MSGRFQPAISAMRSLVIIALLYAACVPGSSAVAQQSNRLGDKVYKNLVLQEIDSLLQAKYVLPDKAAEYATRFREKYETGCYDSYTDQGEFAKQVTADLRQITGDEHVTFRVIESSDVGETPRSSLHHPVRYHVLGIKENRGFSKLEWMEGNIGYLDIRRFYNFSDVRRLVVGAMDFLSNADAIIIDLRENGGGSGDYLSSYFLEYPTQLNSWYSREDDFLKEFWTTGDIGAERLTEVPLFLLTSERTFSASESFAYDMKVRKRATVIGEPTRGGAHSVDLYEVGDQFEIYIPTARAINPITKSNWEGTGVVPDVAVPSESALDTATVLARKAGADYAETKDARLKSAVEEMERYMDRAEALFLEGKHDEGEADLDSVFHIASEHGLVNEFFMDVLAYHYTSRVDTEILYAILKKRIELFPQSPASYESLAYAYYKNGERELAVANFERVLELDPDNRNALKMIRQIRKE
jgi:tetratricopeptide (TPR) repeat protein